MALLEDCRIIAWLRPVLNRLDCLQNHTVIYQDSNRAIEWATEGLAQQLSARKQVYVIYHYAANMFDGGQTQISKIATEKIDADFLTKLLGLALTMENI